MLTTERLIIKPYENSDEFQMLSLLTDETIKKNFMIPDFQTQEAAMTLVHKIFAFSKQSDHYERGIYIQNELIGFVNDVEIHEGHIELGYVIHPKYHNKGYATEMLKAVIQDLFDLGYQTVIAAAFETNPASFRVMEKSGMHRIERTEDIWYHNLLQHCLYYAIDNPNKR